MASASAAAVAAAAAAAAAAREAASDKDGLPSQEVLLAALQALLMEFHDTGTCGVDTPCVGRSPALGPLAGSPGQLPTILWPAVCVTPNFMHTQCIADMVNASAHAHGLCESVSGRPAEHLNVGFLL